MVQWSLVAVGDLRDRLFLGVSDSVHAAELRSGRWSRSGRSRNLLSNSTFIVDRVLTSSTRLGGLSRRNFLQSVVASGTLAQLPALGAETPARSAIAEPGDQPWYKTAYRRAVIDMHIPDWDPQFLAKFDAEQYADSLLLSRSQSIVCYAHSHVGLFNYPTEVGRQHHAWKGRDALAEVINGCHARNIAVVLYCSLIFDRYAADTYPEWRVVDWRGEPVSGGRHGLLCPNSPYRDYVRRFAEEMSMRYQVEGVRFDMTFWPRICYCEYCEARFQDEAGGDMPKVVDWLDPQWVSFQRCRSRWLDEFASLATTTIKQNLPAASVEHQSSTYPKDWQNGVTGSLADSNDFLQGDFYGDRLQGSFVRKLLEDLTPNRPFGYETSVSVSLQDHTAIKPEPLLRAKAAAALADHAAFIFIDSINPDGTVDTRTQSRMGEVFDRFHSFYEHLGGQRVRDVVGYYSFESKIDFRDNGTPVREAANNDTHTTSSMNAASRLLARHVPYGVATKKSLANINAKVLLLSSVNMMDDEECRIIRDWVHAGGQLYASGITSAVDKSGRLRDDFMLSDVFGVSLVDPAWQARRRYLSPTDAGAELFEEFSPKYPAFFNGPGTKVRAHTAATVLATTTLPWDDGDPTHFASIHSDPPWTPTDTPEVVLNHFGSGRCIYSAAPIEDYQVLAEVFVRMIGELCPHYAFSAEAPDCVEITLFRQAEHGRYTMALSNFQEETLARNLQNVPVTEVKIQLRIPERIDRVVDLATSDRLRVHYEGDTAHLVVPRVETLSMLAIYTNS